MTPLKGIYKRRGYAISHWKMIVLSTIQIKLKKQFKLYKISILRMSKLWILVLAFSCTIYYIFLLHPFCIIFWDVFKMYL